MINFVVKGDNGQKVIGQIRRMVTVSTSLVLAIYIVIAGGMTGWTMWVSSRQKQNSATGDDLTRQINGLFDSEVVVRNLSDRTGMLENFLQSRGSASAAAFTVQKDGFSILKWEYDVGGVVSVGISASDPAQLKEYADFLGTNYSKVQVSGVEWTAENGWTGTFLLTGKKKT